MENVIPFRAWRYSAKAGDLEQLIAPPYDVIGPELQSRLYARSRYNVVRVDLGMTTPSDNECDDPYTRAASQLAAWKEQGILVRDPAPSLTFVEESFTGPDGRKSVRYGFLALLRLCDFAEGIVFPHEQTLAGPKEDRFRLMKATEMSLSPVFLLYDLPGDEISAAWKAGPGPSASPITLTGHDATVTKLWPTSDPALLSVVGKNLAAARFIIADGHHRYETALRYQRHRRKASDKTDGTRPDAATGAAAPDAGAADGEESAVRNAAAGAGAPGGLRTYDYVLAYLANRADPGLTVYATHRLIAGVEPQVVASLPGSLAPAFSIERLIATPSGSTSSVDVSTAIAGYLEAHPRRAFGMWGPGFDAAYGLMLVDDAPLRAAVPERSPAFQELDVTILQGLVLEKALGITAAHIAGEDRVTYCKDSAEAFARLEAREFQVGFFMNPTGLDQISGVAFGGERMPQKATYFYPKLPTGLVFLDLSDGF